MSSEVITRNDLKNVLDAILPSLVGWEYVGNVGSDIFNGSWTATDNGMMVVVGGANSSGGIAYWYIKDTTANIYVANLFWDNANGTWRSSSFPIIKGHVYTSSDRQSISTVNAHFYKSDV